MGAYQRLRWRRPQCGREAPHHHHAPTSSPCCGCPSAAPVAGLYCSLFVVTVLLCMASTAYGRPDPDLLQVSGDLSPHTGHRSCPLYIISIYIYNSITNRYILAHCAYLRGKQNDAARYLQRAILCIPRCIYLLYTRPHTHTAIIVVCVCGEGALSVEIMFPHPDVLSFCCHDARLFHVGAHMVSILSPPLVSNHYYNQC